MATLTDADKERIRYHMGYMAASFAASLQLGMPRPVQTLFLLEQAMGLLVEPNAVNRVICLLDILDGIEKQMRDATKFLGAEAVGGIKLRSAIAGQTYPDLLEREYSRWAKRLADVFGAPLYGFSTKFKASGPGMIPRG